MNQNLGDAATGENAIAVRQISDRLNRVNWANETCRTIRVIDTIESDSEKAVSASIEFTGPYKQS